MPIRLLFYFSVFPASELDTNDRSVLFIIFDYTIPLTSHTIYTVSHTLHDSVFANETLDVHGDYFSSSLMQSPLISSIFFGWNSRGTSHNATSLFFLSPYRPTFYFASFGVSASSITKQ